MANIVIKKTISLEFLGEDYKDGSVTFRSLSIGEVDNLLERAKEFGDDNKAAFNFMIEVLEKAFITGVWVDNGKKEEITLEDLKQFDMESVIKFFEILTGQGGDLKA